MRVGVLLLILSFAGWARAQSNAASAPDPSSFGSVVGHVSLPESNLPARMANVALQPVDMQSSVRAGLSEAARMPVSVVQTGLDGSYRLDRVPPGSYYVVVNLPGFLSPIAQFTPDQLKNPTPDVQQRIASTVPMVDVRAANTISADVRLSRGASLSGLVRYDDGSATPKVMLELLKHNPNGHWDRASAWNRPFDTDDEGRFRLFGLAPGEYKIKVTLEVRTQRQDAAYGRISQVSSQMTSSIAFFSGDTVVESEARVVKLTDGQTLTGQDITIPVSKLHRVSGAVVDAHTGQPLNSGAIALVAPDGQGFTSATIDEEARTFTFPFAPEGEYTLQTNSAAEVQPTGTGVRRYYSKPLRSYDAGKVSIVIHGDVTGITVPVTEKTTVGAKAP